MLKYCGHLFLFSLLFCVIIWLSACTPKYNVIVPNLTFSHVLPIRLTSTDVKQSDSYVPSLSTPQVEHLMPTPLYAAVDQLMVQMFDDKTANNDVTQFVLNADLVKASVKHTKLPEPASVFLKLGSYPEDQYDFDVRVAYVLNNLNGDMVVDGFVQIKGRNTLQSDLSPAGRDMAFVKMTEHIGTMLEQETRKLFRQKFTQIYHD